jgi:hypothetical protein
MLPAAATDAVRGAIEVVSPVDFGPSDHPDNHGRVVSADAKGDSDGEPGVDGRAVAESAPGAAHRADGAPAMPDQPPGQTGETGVTRANQTPAAPHAPDVAPSTVGDHGSGDPDGDGQPGTQPADHPTPPTSVAGSDRSGAGAGG